MAKKRKMVRRKATKAKPARRRARSKKSDPDETMNIIAGILVVILIGLGIYFYQTTQKTGALTPATHVVTIDREPLPSS